MPRLKMLGVAQVGDLCILLVPTYSQSPVIRTQLADLQRQFGGEIVAPLHVTCQRFSATAAQVKALKPRLTALCEGSAAVHVNGTRLEPFYSTFRSQEILKCHVEPSRELSQFVAAVEFAIVSVAIESNYTFSEMLVTLLEGVKLNHLNTFTFRRKLFIGQRLLLTQVKSPGHYTTLFSGVQEAELQVSDLF